MIEGHLKRAIFRVLDTTGVIAISEAVKQGVPILVYHGVTETKDAPLTNRRRLHVSKRLFAEHLRYLCHRCRPVPLSALTAARNSPRRLPPRAVVVTIDDAYRNALTVALPLLNEFKVPATLFVVTGVDQQ